MPELPEVEVVKRSLINKTQNLIVKAVKINDGRLRYKIDRNKIKKIIGLKFIKISRKSKYLLFFFNKNIVMLVHLGMTGKFFFVNQKKIKYKTSFYYDINDDKDKKHNHIIFDLSNNQKLIYNDIRKFGFIKIIKRVNLDQNIHLKYLGPEPLSNKFNIEYFKNFISGKNRTIKDILMDQKFISGLGNIYVNEILYYSGLKPAKNVKKLTHVEIKKIIKFSKKIISKAISLGGSSIKDFSSSSGKKGSFQQYFRVYGKKGENCPSVKCKGKIKKIIIANRASFFCNRCQK
jgi:formamidopyrimidine-DNA glycosylase